MEHLGTSWPGIRGGGGGWWWLWCRVFSWCRVKMHVMMQWIHDIIRFIVYSITSAEILHVWKKRGINIDELRMNCRISGITTVCCLNKDDIKPTQIFWSNHKPWKLLKEGSFHKLQGRMSPMTTLNVTWQSIIGWSSFGIFWPNPSVLGVSTCSFYIYWYAVYSWLLFVCAIMLPNQGIRKWIGYISNGNT